MRRAYPVGMEAVARFFGADVQWTRPGPTTAERWTDLRYAVYWLLAAACGLEFLRGMGAVDNAPAQILWQYVGTASGALLLALRRSHPLVTAAGAAVHMLVLGVLIPPVMSTLPMQVIYFFALFSGVSWARDRRALTYVVGGVVAVMFLWLTWAFALTSGVSKLTRSLGIEDPATVTGLLSPTTSVVLYTVLNNIFFFGGAILLGQMSWRGAWRTAEVVRQAETIRQQTARLRDQAVVAERLRIARELHDVVAHHVSVMGVQASAARRVLTRDPEAAATALSAVETSSRQAVGQMRDLLGTLRSGEKAADGTDGDATGETNRTPQPDLAAIEELIDQAAAPTLEIGFRLVETPEGAAAQVSPPVQLSCYRIVQESLANVRRHSTATRANVVVRVAEDWVEVEVVDNGSPRPGTSGTGLGQLGMRERAQHLGGLAEMGPRRVGGYRVRVRFPVSGTPPTDPSDGAASDAGAAPLVESGR